MPRIEDDFADIPDSTPGGNARKWDYTIDSPAQVLTFETGPVLSGYTTPIQPIVLSVGNGESFLARVPAERPNQPHQSVEAVMLLGTNIGSNAVTGVFCKYQSVNQYVLGRFNHNTLEAELVEVIGGVATVLATAPLTAASDTTGVSLRLEVIGIRARLFFEPHYRDVPDQPPDIAADLTGTYATVGEWGVYMKSNQTANDMAITRFYARNLPESYAQPPSLYVENASGRNYVPITAAVTSIPNSAVYLEWEIMPVDDLDFAEKYHDLCIDSLDTRVFYVRAGYTYDIRVRAVKKSGGTTDWVTRQITASGTKVEPDAGEFSDDEWPVNVDAPDYVLSRNAPTKVNVLMPETGRERIVTRWPRPRNRWTMRFLNRTRDEFLLVERFFKDMGGREKIWKWTHPTNADFYNVRFDTDELTFTPIDDEFDGAGPLVNFDVPMIECALGVLSTLSPVIALDDSLRPA